MRLWAAQALLRLLYDDEGVFYRRYHAVVTGDAAARVSRWAPLPRDPPPVPGLPQPAPGDLTRSVTFVKRMELPAAITRLLGAAGCPARVKAAAAASPKPFACAFSAHVTPGRAGDVSALEVEEVQRLRAAGGRGGGAEIFSAPVVKMKVRGGSARCVALLRCALTFPRRGRRGWTSSPRRW